MTQVLTKKWAQVFLHLVLQGLGTWQETIHMSCTCIIIYPYFWKGTLRMLDIRLSHSFSIIIRGLAGIANFEGGAQ